MVVADGVGGGGGGEVQPPPKPAPLLRGGGRGGVAREIMDHAERSSRSALPLHSCRDGVCVGVVVALPSLSPDEASSLRDRGSFLCLTGAP